jgi:hypothetical protein
LFVHSQNYLIAFGVQKFEGCRGDLVGCDLEQAVFWVGVSGVVSLARSMAQHSGARAVGAIACRIGWPKQSDDRSTQSCGEMKRAGVSSDNETGTSQERDQLRYVAGKRNRRSITRPDYRFSGRVLD